MADYTETQRTTWLTDDQNQLIPTLQSGFSWSDYAALQDQIEYLLRELYLEVDDTSRLSEYALSLGDSTLEEQVSAVHDLLSQLKAYQIQADYVASQNIPLTGSQYTKLIVETFANTGILDLVSDIGDQGIVLSEPVTSLYGCPTRPPLEIDTTQQKLRLYREGSTIAFSGLPGSSQTGSLGGIVTVDKIYGTPVTRVTNDMISTIGVWSLSVASRFPLARGFSYTDSPLAPWLPDSYQGGGAVRLHVNLYNPSPISEVRVRGALLSTGLNTQLLETVAAVSSRSNPVDLTTHPGRALNSGGFTGASLSGWSLTPNSKQRWAYAPDRSPTLYTSSPGTTDWAIVLNGQAYTSMTVRSNSQYILRYRAFCPYHMTGGVPPPSGAAYPVPPSATYVSIYYYSVSNPTFGTTSPVYISTIRDPYAVQGDAYAGAQSYVHLAKTPKNAVTAILVIGTDPYLMSGLSIEQRLSEIAYSDVWFCDEALVQTVRQELPSPTASNLVGPSVPGGTNSFTEQDAVEALSVSIGNISGGFIITDVWVTIGQTFPDIETVSSYKTLEESAKLTRPQLPPYALSLPVDIPSSKVGHDPLLLHQARYVGVGRGEWDASKYRLSGQMNSIGLRSVWPSLYARFWGQSSVRSRAGRRDPLPYESVGTIGSYWKTVPGQKKRKTSPLLALASLIKTNYPNIWNSLVSLSKSKRSPLSRPIQLLTTTELTPTTVDKVDNSSLYVYTMGLSSLDLLREEYASSGIHMTKQIQEIGGSNAVAGEIREVGVLTDPPIDTFGGRLRLWISPDSQVLEGTSQDTVSNILARAVPLDSTSPRASFHSTAESMTCVVPATSDIVTQWQNNTSQILSQPAFAVAPTIAVELIQGGIPPDQVTSGVKLQHVPYINREAIYKIAAAISSGTVANPLSYDPNAISPIVTLLPGSNLTAALTSANLSATGSAASGNVIVSGENIFRVLGYRPIAVRLQLPNGQVILPDALGSPTPGKVVYSGDEILKPAAGFNATQLPSDPALYSYQTETSDPTASNTSLSFTQTYQTARSPIAAGDNGAAIQLWWHKSTDFDAASGGIQTDRDVQINTSNFTVNTTTGLVTILEPPPYNWDVYDQIRAQYYWSVGNTAAYQSFPQPALSDLFTPFVPFIVGQGTPTPPQALYQPMQEVPIAPIVTGELLPNYNLANGRTGFGDFNQLSNPTSFNLVPPAPPGGRYWETLPPGGGMQWKIPYPGSGIYQFGMWGTIFGPGPANFLFEIAVMPTNQVPPVVFNFGPALQYFSFTYMPPTAGTTGYPCMSSSQVDNATLNSSSPPSWFPSTQPLGPYNSDADRNAAWASFKSTLSLGTQEYYQWPSYGLVAGGSEATWVVGTDGSNPPPAGSNPDNISVFAVTEVGSSTSTANVGFPYAVNIPITANRSAGEESLTLVVSLRSPTTNNLSTGLSVTQANLIVETPRFTLGCVPPYVYDSITNLCKYTPSTPGSPSGDVTTGTDAGTLQQISLAQLFAGTYTQQSYPVTRNVTNYASNIQGQLTPANMDPLSPSYYPVFEYRIDPGGVLVFANDFSSLGQYAGTNILVEYDYLDISPRLIVEILPEGQTCFDLPSTPISTTIRPAVETPTLNSLNVVLNTRV